MEKINEVARDYATKCHTDTNHLFDCIPYMVHLSLVVMAMQRFIHLIPEEDRKLVEASCWVHDVIEDCRQTYNDVKNVCGEQVAEIAYALTNEKGKTRKERANENYYKGILEIKYAPFVKLCDRIANIEYSKDSASRMFKMYCKENNDFARKLYKPEYSEMIEYLLRFGSAEVEVRKRNFEWVCNECNFPNLTSSVSEDEIEQELHSCINCGGFEMRKRYF